MKNSWLKIHRRILASDVSQDDELLGLFIRLLLTVNYEPRFFKAFKVEAGSMVFGWRNLPERLYPKTPGRPSKNTLIRRMKILEEIGVIAITVHESNKFSVLAIPNWRRYQGKTVPKIGTLTGTLTGTLDDERPKAVGTLTGTLTGTEIRSIKKEKKDTGGIALSPSPESILDAFNKANGRKYELTAKRRTATLARLKEPFFASNWEAAIAKVVASPFCQGQNDRGWKADFDWFIRPDSVTRIMEFKYDSKTTQTRTTSTSTINQEPNHIRTKRLREERRAAEAKGLAS